MRGAPKPIVLASSSPQRARLLAQLAIVHETAPADIDETPRPGETAEALAERLARGKADAIAPGRPDALVIGSDTVVALGDRLYGKPVDDADADRMLASLSGQTHRVVSGVAVALNGQTVSCTATSHVTLRTLADAERAAYIASGEPTGKAGAYAIQGLGAVFIARLDGSYSSVMGLPLFETARLLKAAGVDLLSAS